MHQYTVKLSFLRAQAEPFGLSTVEKTEHVNVEIEPFNLERWLAGNDAVLRAVKEAAIRLGAPEDIAHAAGVAAACGDWFARRFKHPDYTWSDPELTVRF